jgi:hypothetical protein
MQIHDVNAGAYARPRSERLTEESDSENLCLPKYVE